MFTNSKHKQADEALKKGEIDKSILLFTEALNLSPNDCNILSDRAVAFLHKEDKLRSMADFNLAIQLDPEYSYRYASRAFARQHFGDLNGAVEDYQKAVELDPDDAVAHNNLGILLEQQGYQKESQERFARADKLSKMEDDLFGVMDEMENKSGDHEKAEITEEATIEETEISEQATEKDPSTSEEMKKVFTSRKQFREFIQFIKNGFKLK